MPLTVARHCSTVEKAQLRPPPAGPPAYWAHHGYSIPARADVETTEKLAIPAIPIRVIQRTGPSCAQPTLLRSCACRSATKPRRYYTSGVLFSRGFHRRDAKSRRWRRSGTTSRASLGPDRCAAAKGRDTSARAEIFGANLIKLSAATIALDNATARRQARQLNKQLFLNNRRPKMPAW